MRIDSISPKADRSGRYSVRFSDGSSIRLYRQTIEDFAIYCGKEFSDADMDSLCEAAGKMSAKMRAVRIVSASNVSMADLEQRLIRKGETPKQAKEAVSWMEDLSLVDDERTAALIVERCAAKGYGRSRAKQMLFEKKIPKELWASALSEYPDQTENIIAFLKKKLSCSCDEQSVKRAIDALLRKGHSYSQIKSALERMNVEHDDFQEDM